MVFCSQFKCFRMFYSKRSITIENMYLLSCWFHCVDVFHIRFRFCETYIVANSIIRILLIEALSSFWTIKKAKCWFTYICTYSVSVNSNAIPPSFLAFHIPLIFARQQLKISATCTLFQPFILQIFCILTITNIKYQTPYQQ